MEKQTTTADKIQQELYQFHPPGFEKLDKPFGIESRYWWTSFLTVCHVFGSYYFFYLLPFGHVPRASFLLGVVYTFMCGFGITIGSHRYWTHRAFKAKFPLQIILFIWQTMTFHIPIITYCLLHRVHHKYADTDADPHNSQRGFWFSHYGWLLQPKHPKCVEKLRTIDVSDVVVDPIVRFQSDYYYELSFIFAFLIPISNCAYVFPELTSIQLFSWSMAIFCVTLNAMFCINSVAHTFGDKPYDKNIKPTDNKWCSMIAIGEGWHNYHHTFPWDYKAAELGWKWNLSAMVIDFFAWIGWAYDLKTVSSKVLVDRITRTGDGTHPVKQKQIPMLEKETNSNTENKNTKGSDNDENETKLYWGWGDEDLKSNSVEVSTIFAS